MTQAEQLRWRRAKEIFEVACDGSPGEQGEIIEGMASGDPALAADVWRLLAIQQQSGLTLDASASPSTLAPYGLIRFFSVVAIKQNAQE